MKLSEILEDMVSGKKAARVSWFSKNGEVISRVVTVREGEPVTPFVALEWGHKSNCSYPWIPQYQDLKASDWFVLTEKDFQEWIGE